MILPDFAFLDILWLTLALALMLRTPGGVTDRLHRPRLTYGHRSRIRDTSSQMSLMTFCIAIRFSFRPSLNASARRRYEETLLNPGYRFCANPLMRARDLGRLLPERGN